MFYREISDQYIQEGVAFVVDGVQYSQTWLYTSTPQEKEQLGLQEVVTIGYPKNGLYYVNLEVLEGPTLTITNVPKDLDECKATATAQVNSTAYSLLFPSDWMVVKAVETSTSVAPDWTTYREAVRTTANQAKADYASFTTVDEIADYVITWPVSPDAPVVVADAPLVEEPVVEDPAPVDPPADPAV